MSRPTTAVSGSDMALTSLRELGHGTSIDAPSHHDLSDPHNNTTTQQCIICKEDVGNDG